MNEMNPGRELDALIAEKVMGFPSPAEPGIDQPEYERRRKSSYPAYSTDFAASMEVVKQIQRVGHPWPFTGLFHEHADIDKLPEAICLAALKAVEPPNTEPYDPAKDPLAKFRTLRKP